MTIHQSIISRQVVSGEDCILKAEDMRTIVLRAQSYKHELAGMLDKMICDARKGAWCSAFRKEDISFLEDCMQELALRGFNVRTDDTIEGNLVIDWRKDPKEL